MRRQGFLLRARLGMGRTDRLLGLALCVAGLAVGCGQTEPQTASQPGGIGRSARVSCDLYASPRGSDSDPGIRARPFRTAGKLVNRLRTRQTGCFRAGTYTFEEIDITNAGVTLAPYRDEAVTLRGSIKVKPTGSGSTIEGMKLDGAGGTTDQGPKIYADGVVLRNNEITNDHTAICVEIGTFYSSPAPKGVVIERNRIHDCGVLPSTNLQHGIYVGDARHAVIRDNWIYNNADRGIQLYPDAQHTKIVGNVIDRNGEGVVLGGRGGVTSNHNLVQANVITNSRDGPNVYSGPGPTATGNVVRNNCVWAGAGSPSEDSNGGIETPSRNFTASANTVVDPSYANPVGGDYRLSAESECPLAGQLNRPAFRDAS
jgi:Right handed beta helix region